MWRHARPLHRLRVVGSMQFLDERVEAEVLGRITEFLTS